MSVCWFIGLLSLLPGFVLLLHWLWQLWNIEKELDHQPPIADVKRLVKKGCRMEAILRYREKFPHIDLREAVYAVDKMIS